MCWYSNKLFFLAIIFFGITCGSYALFGQPLSTKIDSFKQLINHSKTDTDKVKLLIGLSRAIKCDDTTYKMHYANEAMQLAEKINWVKGKARVNATIGFIYAHCVKNDSVALKYYEQSLSLSKISRDKSDQVDELGGIAASYMDLAQYGKALDYYREALELQTGPVIAIVVLGNMGNVYNSVGDYTHALTCYDSSLLVLDEWIRTRGGNIEGDTMQRAGLLMTIAEVYIGMAQYDMALDNYNKALLLIKRTNRKEYGYYALIGIGQAYMCKKEPVKAIEYYTLALEESKTDKRFTRNLLDKLGNAYLATGDIPKAMDCAQQALQLAQQYGDSVELPRIYTTTGKIFSAEKNYPQAVSYLQNAISLCKQTGALNDEKEAWCALSNTYEQMGQTAKAFDAYRKFISLRDSVYNIDKAKDLVRIDLQSGFNIKQLADSLKQDEARKVIMLKLQRQRVVSFGGFVALLLVLSLLFFIYKNYSQQKKANKIISEANATIQNEKQVSESLLLNILPEEVAVELKASGKVLAKSYDEVTVLFTDFIDFTKAGQKLSAQHLVAELDNCFQAFDQIIGKYNIEKIKTVGDAYMAVSGLPKAYPNHAIHIVKAAIEIRDYMKERKRNLCDETFGIRIGINSGGVVAGIVGVKKFAYDIWGDTVNTAARMEQHSEDGKINISQTTYELVNDKIHCRYRGEIDVKGKGMLKMYYVE